jgi:glycosyl transferase, family 25
MRTAQTPSPTSSQPSGATELNGAPQALLRHVPTLELQCNNDFAQPIGIDLPVIVINLASRTDKLQRLSSRMSAIGLTKLIRAPAIEAQRLPARQMAALLRSSADATNGGPGSHLTLTPPAIGCFLSHLAVWRWMLTSGLTRLLVFEDDATPVAHFSADRFLTFLGDVPGETGPVFLGCAIMGGLAERPQGKELSRLYYFNGTFAYLITRTACQALLQQLLPLHAHLDHQISEVLMEMRHVFSAYCATPPFFDHDWSLGSDCYVALSDALAADHELGHIIATRRQALLKEGRPLLPEHTNG